jgi:hypothetical protein
VLWQTGSGAWTLTFVCKATYRLAPTESELADEQEAPNEEDNYWDDDTTRSLYAPSDLVPFKARADVLLVGHAFAPRDEPKTSLIARLTVGSMSKAIECCRDRRWTLEGQLREGPRITRVPLRYERAAGGQETSNPVGMRLDAADAYGMVHLPNLQPPGTSVPKRGEGVEAVGFGPIAPTWPTRVEKLGRYAPSWTAATWSSQPVPDDLDPAYWNCAPRDQQIDVIRPDERILLENLHPEHPRLVTNLSGLSPVAAIERAGAALEPIQLTCDTLWIDTDRSLCTLVWRGRVALKHPGQAGRVVVSTPAGARGSQGASPRPGWKEAAKPDGFAGATRPQVGGAPVEEDVEVTHVHGFSEQVGGLESLPFVKPREPWNEATSEGAQEAGSSTLPFMRAEDVLPKAQFPFQARPSPPAPPPPAPSDPGAMRAVEHGAPQGMAPAQAPPVMPPMVRPPPPVDPIPPSLGTTSPWASRGGSGLGPASGAGLTKPPLLPADPAPQSASYLSRPSSPGPTSPSPTVAAAGGAVAASNAAAMSARAAAAPPPAPLPTPAARPAASYASARDALVLLWFDPSFVKPISENPPWAALLAKAEGDRRRAPESSPGDDEFEEGEFDDNGDDDDDDDVDIDGDDASDGGEEPPEEDQEEDDVPQEVRDRRTILKVLARGEISTAAGISRTVAGALSEDGTLEPPLVLVSGELVFPFDELETLKATVTAVSPLVAGDKKLKEVVDTVNELLKTPWLSRSGSVAEGLTARVKEAFAQGNRVLPPSYLDSHTERMLLEERHYQKRTIFGQTWIRSLFVPASSQESIPAYLPESLSKQLPMFQRLKARIIAEVHLQQDQYESHPSALRVVALARVSSLAPVPGGEP